MDGMDRMGGLDGFDGMERGGDERGGEGGAKRGGRGGAGRVRTKETKTGSG